MILPEATASLSTTTYGSEVPTSPSFSPGKAARGDESPPSSQTESHGGPADPAPTSYGSKDPDTKAARIEEWRYSIRNGAPEQSS